MGLSCPFCRYTGPNPVIFSDQWTYMIEPLHPVTEGHRLIIPHRHVEDAAEDPQLTGRVFANAAEYVQEEGIEANLITSVGPCATQSVYHLHVHVVPRSPDDGLALPWSEPGLVVRKAQAAPITQQYVDDLDSRGAHQLAKRLRTEIVGAVPRQGVVDDATKRAFAKAWEAIHKLRRSTEE